MSTRLDQAKEAMKAIEHQDYEPAMALVAPDYKHHSTRGIEVTGPKEFREILVPQLEQIRLVQRLESIIESGEFVVATVRATSTLREGESSIVYVFRYEDDRIAEAWAISPPVGAA
ncbi:MAG TPA: nuclear transport factor 2 family protein [Acidimicrobiales bacterium]|nr:nuclear transport factor 2 family protein [Acidimicrobiales bacterium]